MQTVAGWLRRGAAAVLQMGPVPRHVAFIMDGNRRFAERQQLETSRGHSRGYDKLVQALEWCLELGVPCVSVYAFSLENFNRSPQEVDVLMDLAEQKLLAILEERGIIERHGVRVQVLGNLSRLPENVAAAARQCMAGTAHQTRCVLNICLAYTSTQEMWQAVQQVQQQVAAGQLAPADVSIASIQQQLYTEGCPPVDLMVRTSGETRLSDFLLPQSGHASLHFSPALWPDFSFLDLLAALAQFQRDAATLQRNAAAATECCCGAAKAADAAASAAAEPTVPPPQAAAAAAAAAGSRQAGAAAAAVHDNSSDGAVSRHSDAAVPSSDAAALRRRHNSGATLGDPPAAVQPLSEAHNAMAVSGGDIPSKGPRGENGSSSMAVGRSGLLLSTTPSNDVTRAIPCRTASQRKLGKQKSVQYEVVAVSSAAATALIS